MTAANKDKTAKRSKRLWWLSGTCAMVMAVLMLKFALNMFMVLVPQEDRSDRWFSPSEVLAEENSPDKQAGAGGPADSTDNPASLRTGLPNDPSAIAAMISQLEKREANLKQREADLREKEATLQKVKEEVEQKLKEVIAVQEQILVFQNQKREKENTKVRSLIKIYENMKPKDAAKLFESLDEKLVVKVISAMKTDLAASILANMEPKQAVKISEALSAQ